MIYSIKHFQKNLSCLGSNIKKQNSTELYERLFMKTGFIVQKTAGYLIKLIYYSNPDLAAVLWLVVDRTPEEAMTANCPAHILDC